MQKLISVGWQPYVKAVKRYKFTSGLSAAFKRVAQKHIASVGQHYKFQIVATYTCTYIDVHVFV